MSRENIHDLVDRIPEEDLPVAKRFLEYLTIGSAHRTALSALPDDEPVTEADVAAIIRAREDVRGGRVVHHDDILREFGLK